MRCNDTGSLRELMERALKAGVTIPQLEVTLREQEPPEQDGIIHYGLQHFMTVDAISRDDPQALKDLIGDDNGVDSVDFTGMTALLTACFVGYHHVVALLLANSAGPRDL